MNEGYRECKFQDIFNRLLERNKISQVGFAYKTGFNQYTVNKWACGKAIPTLESAMDIAQFFGVSLDYLVYGD